MIEVKGISRSFIKDNNIFKVLEDISFAVEKGEILCLLGTSGCGKTTLLRLLGGFDKANCGSIEVNCKPVDNPSPDVILIFQDFNQLLPWKTVLQNITYPMKVNGKGENEQQRRKTALEYLELVRLKDFQGSYPHELSGGMKQKAALAKALALTPSVLLMDEPFGSLDALTRQSLQQVLLDAWRETGVTIIFVTHDIQEAIILSDRIVVMDREPGRIKEVISNKLSRPRNVSSDEYIKLYQKLQSLLCST